MKSKAALRPFLVGSIIFAASPMLHAVNLYWDTDGVTLGAGGGTAPTGTWSTGGSTWSGSLLGVFANPAATTTSLDDLFFSAGTTASGSYTVTVSGTQNARLLTFEEGTATLSGGTIVLGGNGGITVATGSGNPSVSSDITFNGNNTLNIGSGRTLSLSGAFTRGTGATLNIQGAGTVTTTMTGGLNASSLVNNIIGPWASFGTGAATSYATINGSNNIVGLGYTGGADGVAPGAASIVTDTTGALNYSVNTATGTLGTNASINTLRYTAAASTLTTATSFTTNGILNAGTGVLTISGNVTIGSTKELVLNAANNGIFIGVQSGGNAVATNANILESGGGPSTLIITGSGTTTLNGLASTYSGGTIVNQGTLTTGPSATGLTTDRPFGNASGTVTVNSGATLALNRTYVPNAVALNNATLTSGNSFQSNLAGGVTLNGANTLNVTGNLTISSNFTGTGTLTRTGSATVTFVSGTNYNAGALTISGGVLGFGNAATLFGGTSATWTPANITVGSGAALGLRYGGGGDFTSAQIDSIISNLTTVSNNGLRAGSFIGFDTTNGNGTYSSVITDSTGTGGGSVGLFKYGGNTLTLGSSNTFSGPVSIGGFAGQNGGTLSVSSFNSVNGGSPTLTSSSLGRPTTQTNGTITLGIPSSASGVGITYTGTGETTDRVLLMNLGGGGFTLDQSGSSGLLKFTSNLGNSSNAARTMTLQGSTAGTGEMAGVLTDAGAVGTNALSINKAGSGTWTLSGANTYSGTTKVTAGTLIVSNSLGLQNSPIDTSGAGTLNFSGLTATPTIGGLAGGTALATVLGSAGVGYSNLTALTLNVVTGTQTYTGAIAATTSGMSLTKTGAGTQVLAGANTFSGTTTIKGGTLTIGNGTAGSLNGTTGTALTFTNTGAFNVAEANASTQGMGALTVSAGDATITSTASGASNAATLTFASLAARPAGATANFVLATNTGTTNKIVFTSTTNAPLNNSGSNNQGIFFGGTEYARYDTTAGYFRAVTYGTDTNASALQGASSSGITVTTGSSADVKLTGAVTGQGTASVNTLNLGANNLTFQATASTLSVNGILGSTGGLVNGTNASSIQTTSAGGELVIYNSGAMTIAPNIINNSGSSVTKSGAGTLTLGGTNTYTGGTVLNAGILSTTADANLGSGGALTVNGIAQWTMGLATSVTYNHDVTINSGAVLTVGSGNAAKTVAGILSGSGSLVAANTTGYYFTNTGNTFTGSITSGYEMQFASLGDSSNPINIANANAGKGFTWTGGTKTFSLRPFTIDIPNTTSNITNNGTGALTISQNLAITGAAGVRTLTLGGSYSGSANVFSGNIADGPGSVVGLAVAGNSTWALSGTNTYSGATTIGNGNPNSTLVIQGLQALSPYTTITMTANSTPASNLKLLDDGTGVLTVPNTIITAFGNATLNNSLIVGNNNTANGGTSTGTTTGSTFAIGKLSFGGSFNATQGFKDIQSLNSNKVQFNSVEFAGVNTNASVVGQFTPTTAVVILAGTIQQLAGNTATTTSVTLDLSGTNTGNLVTGVIKDAVDFGTNANAQALKVLKSSSGTWTLSGTNTYSGTTTVSAGTLASTIAVQGFGTNLNGISVAAAGTLSLLNNGTVSFTNGTSAYNIANSASGATINVDRVSGTGSNTITVGNLTTSSTSGVWGLNFTGANGVSLSAGALSTPVSTIAATHTITNNIAGGGSLTLASVFNQATTIANPALVFAGTGNTTVTGAITQTLPSMVLTKNGAGTLTLNGTNSYSGITTINAGVVEAAVLASGSSNSSIGASSNLAANLVFGAPSATLRYTGSSNVTIDRGFTTSTGAGGGATIESSGAGTLSFNNSVAIAYGTGSQTRTLTLGGTNTGANTFGKVIANNTGTTNATSLVKSGIGTWILDQANTYSGTTSVNAGTLNVSSGNINSTSGIAVAAGATFAYNSSTALTRTTTLNGTGTGAGQRAVLGGTGPFNTAVTLDNLGDTLSPGNSPGIMSFATGQTWASNSYDWEINDWLSSVAGTDIDQIQITGILDLSATASNSYLLNILSLAPGNASGDVSNFAETGNSWSILTTTGGITGFNSSEWQINSAGFSNLETGTWSLAQSGNDLVLTYAPVPEPRVALLGGLSLLALLRRRRR